MTSVGVGVGVGLQRVTGEGGGFVPPASLLAWYDTSDTSTLDQHPGLVEFMTDLAFNFNLSQPTLSQRPTSGAFALNGLNLLAFTRQDNEKLLTGPISIPVYDGNDICLSVICSTVDDTTEVVFDMENLGTLRNDGFNFDGGAGGDNIGHPKTIGPQLLTIHVTDTESSFYKNGVLINTEPFLDEPPRTINELDMGQNSYLGLIGECILWRDAADITAVNDYLIAKWAITPALPTPGTLSTLLAWYTSSDLTTITDASGPVSLMLDESVNDYDLEQIDINRRPTSGSTTLNGLNVLDFSPDPGGDSLDKKSISIPVFDGNDICLSVVCIASDTNTRKLFKIKKLGDLQSDGFKFEGPVGSDNTGHPKTTGPQILTIHITDTESTFYKDGVLIHTEPFADESALNITELKMCDKKWSGSVASVVLWRDPANIPLVINYQKQKWGIA